jgi:hypothetical protein
MTASATPPTGRLNEVQISLLRLFEHGMTEEQTQELKRVLVAHYTRQLAQEVEKVSAERGYTATDFEQMLQDPS